MIYCPGRFLFVHIPRSAGFSITQALASQIRQLGGAVVVTAPLGACVPGGWWTHSRADELRSAIPDWDDIVKFAVTRSPWDAVGSHWRWCQTFWGRMKNSGSLRPEMRMHWKYLYPASVMSFSQWVPWAFEYLQGSGGFWNHYCDDSFIPIRFTHLQDDSRAVCKKVGLAPIELPHENTVPAQMPKWNRATVEFVGKLCLDDVRRFGYEPP